MKLNDYQKAASSTNLMKGQDTEFQYLVYGLGEECGEVQGIIKRVLRDKDGQLEKSDYAKLVLELGDTLWYLSQLAAALGATLEDVAQANVAKLTRRQQNNTLQGEGDER